MIQAGDHFAGDMNCKPRASGDDPLMRDLQDVAFR